ncbi:MAG: protein-L-isoaspartate(D-aspartate) O-methyltransferase [Gammaproteobacteria bacterium]|nr:protein-L-isoaspartate(D-aspartate) O-methyltransferase [Gammaproteobacteria bacterium]
MNTRVNGIGMTSQRTRERLVARLREQGIMDERVLDVMRTTPRHLFVDEALASRAYEDTALPIGFGQTISQPFTVARMTEALISGLKPTKVLEIGTGSGYQTAVLAQLVETVYTVERIHGLQIRARKVLRELHLHNIHYKYDDGNMGWTEQAPFDAIIVTAAPRDIPDTLLHQLAVGGRMLIPSGESGKQVLRMVVKTQDGYEQSILENVQFVPMLGGRV